MYVLNTLLPVFAMVALGMILRKKRFLSDAFVKDINKLVFWVALPVLLFYSIAVSKIDIATAGKTWAVVMSATIATIIAGWVTVRLLKIPKETTGTFLQGAFRGNLLYISLPVIVYSFKTSPAETASSMEALTILVLALIIPVYNVLSVVFLLESCRGSKRVVNVNIAGQIIKNPLIIACALGLLYSYFFDSMPIAADRIFSAVGGMSLPLALITVGATLAGRIEPQRFANALAASLLKIFFCPLVGFGVALLIGLTNEQMRVALILLACPTAAASYVMADQMGGDGKLASAIIVITTFLSVLSLAMVLALF